MTFVLYELAKQPELQDRLRNEINEVLAKYNDEITYDSIKEITYLQQVLDGEFVFRCLAFIMYRQILSSWSNTFSFILTCHKFLKII